VSVDSSIALLRESNVESLPTLRAVEATFGKWLHMPDLSALHVVLGTIAANLRAGDPVWLLLVGAPGGGKTELLQALGALENVHPTATLTEAALLSGTPKRDKAKDASGGLLRTIGDFGIIVCKDFGSVLSMHRDARGQALAALREIYDGSWTRHVGTDGGRTLSWAGKVGLVAGCTPTVDRHHAVMSAMGERFVLFRLPALDDAQQMRQSLGHAGREHTMRAELAHAVEQLFAHNLQEPRERSEQETERLIALARLVVRCRSAVERDRYTRDIELIPPAELPARLGLTLDRLLSGLDAIGLGREPAWAVITKAALDSIPQARRDVMHLLHVNGPMRTAPIADALGYPTMTARRAIEDLKAHGIVDRLEKGGGNKGDLYGLGQWAQELYGACVPATSGGGNNGRVPATSDSLLSSCTEIKDIAGKQIALEGGTE
jgi:hypothetical protein